MTTSRTTSFLSEIRDGRPIPPEKLAYFQSRLQARLYDFVMSRFEAKAKEEGLTRAELARRIGRKPEIVTRLFSSPGNWRLTTASDLLLGIAGEELEMAAMPVLDRSKRNDTLPRWATHQDEPRSHLAGIPELARQSTTERPPMLGASSQ